MIFDGLDFRSKKDDAWYACGVVLDGKKLRVKFKDFVESFHDEVFSIADFSTHREIEQFLLRFRPTSMPIEENECSKVIEGMMVSATYTRDGLVRFFDAIVDAVNYKEHTPGKCICTYLLFWQHGPAEGNITAASIDDICLIMSGAIDPRVTEFAKLVREKLRGASSQSSFTSKAPFLSKKTSSNQTLIKLQEFSGDGDSRNGGSSEGREKFKIQLNDQDRDMGGVKDTGFHHYIILENLEKNLSPVLMTEFIHEHTSITAQAYVFLSLSAETYARGALVLNSKSKLKRIYEFINNPNHFIVSSSGRPWVIAEDMLRNGTFNINLQSLQLKCKNQNTESKLIIVRLGTDEYMRAKQLKEIYMEFRDHVNILVEKLDMEEKKNLNPSSAN
ncbi:uncharacterized protein LOC111900488 [Lactuca sativa]|uniref:uncharacterized protein LOC111900488 n=1 Tax=Lactuca sativa TaxID=4236 RepID=UPI000CD9D66B|nr:uncharacterized protein LOC111900488 [Lactuca sativa]